MLDSGVCSGAKLRVFTGRCTRMIRVERGILIKYEMKACMGIVASLRMR